MNTILIACRGEIASRIARTAKDMGYRSVVIHDQGDAAAPFVRAADQAFLLEGFSLAETYLNEDQIIDVAKKVGAHAVHPGYGFLSENPSFAQKVLDASLIWIGPKPETMRLMAHKGRAREAMAAAGIPTIPGYEGDDQSLERLEKEAAKIGYPVMLKAAFGGGGRGIRVLEGAEQLKDQVESACREAEAAFGDASLILEKKIDLARHVEVQILGDKGGRIISLGERDCSVQRRQQKVLEESPAPGISEKTRKALWQLARKAAASCQYESAGTVEFLVDQKEEIFFLEMNTRIQVEHPVTEQVTGIDLVAEQIRIAWGEGSSIQEDEVTPKGHAIELRLYLEDPYEGFLPQIGEVFVLKLPEGTGIRVDHDLARGLKTRGDLDPMVAKIMAYGRDRRQALVRLQSALADTRLLGVGHNLSYIAQILETSEFQEGRCHTQWLATASLQRKEEASDLAIAGLALWLQHQAFPLEFSGFRIGRPTGSPFKLELTGKAYQGEVSLQPRQKQVFDVLVTGASFEIKVHRHSVNQLTISLGGLSESIDYYLDDRKLWLYRQGRNLCIINRLLEPADTDQGADSGLLKAPMAGAVTKVFAKADDTVAPGETLIILEAMKMEHEIKSTDHGHVEAMHVKPGQQVKLNQPMVVITYRGESHEA